MRLLPKSIHRCRRYPTKFNSGRDIPLVGTGVEVSMDVEFTVDLIKGSAIGWPRMENDDFIMVLGSARPLLQALQHATTELQGWLMSDYGYDERTSSLLMDKCWNTRSRTSWIPTLLSSRRSANRC